MFRLATRRVVAAATAATARHTARVPSSAAPMGRLFAAQRFMSAHEREGWVVVEETGASKFQNTVNDGRHEVIADEPGSIEGGMDSGMNPYAFLLSALGTCTSMTLRMYAARDNIPLEKSRVFLKHGRVWAKDCDECQAKSGRVDVIEVDVELEGSQLTQDHRRKLMKIANMCPVHKTLTTETLVHVNQVKDDVSDSASN